MPQFIKEQAEVWPELAACARAQQARLEEKAPTWGKNWKCFMPDQVLQVLNDHVYILEEAIYDQDHPLTAKKAADVANLAMMLHDISNAIVNGSRVCRVCGCTDLKACEGGCSWVPDLNPEGQYLCSKCKGKPSEQ